MNALPTLPKYESLQAFQQRLSAKIQAAQTQSNSEQLRLHVLIAGRHFLLSLPDTKEVIEPSRVTPVPLTQPWYLGLANLRGDLTSVVDTAYCLGWTHQPTPLSGAQRWVVLASALGLHCAILVDAVLGLVNIASDDWQLCVESDADLFAALPWLAAEKQGGIGKDYYGQTFRTNPKTSTNNAVWACELSLQALVKTEDFLQAARI